MLERDWFNSLGPKPSIAHRAHVVLRGQWLKDRDGERKRLISLRFNARPHVLGVNLVPGETMMRLDMTERC